MNRDVTYDLYRAHWTDEHRAALRRLVAGAQTANGSDELAASGFAGVSLGLEEVLRLAHELAAFSVPTMIVEDKYRTPHVTLEVARTIAEKAIHDTVKETFPTETFEPVRFLREAPPWWTFFAPSPTLDEKGHIPGGVLCSVDKHDGSIVDMPAQERAYQLMHAWRMSPGGR